MLNTKNQTQRNITIELWFSASNLTELCKHVNWHFKFYFWKQTFLNGCFIQIIQIYLKKKNMRKYLPILLLFLTTSLRSDVFQIKIEGTIDLGLPPYIERIVQEAEEAEATAIAASPGLSVLQPQSLQSSAWFSCSLVFYYTKSGIRDYNWWITLVTTPHISQ